MSARRILVVTPDRVGPRRAGIGQRHIGIARALARRGFDVTLASTDSSSTRPMDDLRFTVLAPSTPLELYDACLVQGTVLSEHPRLARLGMPVVVDLICPFFLENLERYRGQADLESRVCGDLEVFREALVLGDVFICGSQRQRHFWLGMLAALGRVDGAATREDPNLERLISVVPFGVPENPPRKRRRVLRGVLPGIGAEDVVLYWSGGLWSWLDPLTPIRAVARCDPRVKLVFTGLQHPQDANPITEMGRRAMVMAEQLGVRDRQVFFLEGWMPAEDLDDYLLEADVGVVAHLATVETTFAVRTRFWDYLHGGLPVIASEGDWAAELIRAQGLGCTVAVGDAGGWADAIETLSDHEARRRCSAAVRRAARTMTWDRVVEPLVRLLEGGLAARPRPVALAAKRRRSKLAGAARGNWRKFRSSVASEGLPTALQKSWRKLFVS